MACLTNEGRLRRERVAGEAGIWRCSATDTELAARVEALATPSKLPFLRDLPSDWYLVVVELAAEGRLVHHRHCKSDVIPWHNYDDGRKKRNGSKVSVYGPRTDFCGSKIWMRKLIALSRKTLMAINRFICEICTKGFERDLNLQLHRQGHNLPWKLKKRANKEEVKRKVYIFQEKDVHPPQPKIRPFFFFCDRTLIVNVSSYL
nr:zinc finger protein JACKDAW-like [Ipomoea batatas]